MKTPEELKEAANDTVRTLLERRLVNGNVHTARPELYFRCEPQEPQAFEGGFQVRVKTWRHWSDARVEMEAESGELMAWSIVSYLDPESSAELTEEDALAAARAVVEIPPDAEIESFFHYDFAPGLKVARFQFRHVHRGLRVDGDHLWVVIHPETLRVIEWARKWRIVRFR